MPDDDFQFPTALPSMADVPADLRDCYRPEAGRFVLTTEAADALASHNAEVAALELAHAAAMGAADKAIAERTDTLHGMFARTAIGNAMGDAGVAGKLMSGAVALFRAIHEIEIEPADDGEGHVVIVRDRFGLQSLDNAVRAWLASDDGKPYAPTSTFQGEFGKIIADLKKQP